MVVFNKWTGRNVSSEYLALMEGIITKEEFEILANTSGHKFNMGEIVTLRETNADSESYLMYSGAAGKDDYWWCNFADIKTK